MRVRVRTLQRGTQEGTGASSSVGRSNGALISKRTLYVIVVIDLIVFGAFLGNLYLHFEQSTANVAMTSFEKEPVFSIGNSTNPEYLVQLLNFTIVNQGSNEVGVFTVVVQVLYNGSVIGTVTDPIGYLSPGNRTFAVDVVFNVIFDHSPSTVTYVALLKWYNLVIGQRNLS